MLPQALKVCCWPIVFCYPCLNVFTRPCQEAKDTLGSHTELEKLYRTVLNYAARIALTARLPSLPACL